MQSFIRLARHARLLAYDDYDVLFDNRTADEYLLGPDQVELLAVLDGTRTRTEVVSLYEVSDKPAAVGFLQELTRTGYLKEIPTRQQRKVVFERIRPYLEGVLFDITSLCNLCCHHCYVSAYYRGGRGQDLTPQEMQVVLDDLAEMNIRDIAVTGGEPILRPDIEDVINGIVDRNIRMGSFFTNGLEITDSFADFIASLPQFTRVYISLDGATPATHAEIRGSTIEPQCLFESAIHAIEMFSKRGVEVTVNTSIHRGNLPELPAMYELLKKLGVSQWRMAVPKPLGRYQQSSRQLKPDWDMVTLAYFALLDQHLAEVTVSGETLRAPLEIELEMLFRTEMLVKPVKLYQPLDPACFYHKNRCSIKANGEVLPCGYFDTMPAGNVRSSPVRDIWLSEEMQSQKRLTIAEVSGCSECELLQVCGTGCRAIAHKLTGDNLAKDEYSCAQVSRFHAEVLPCLLEKYSLQLTTTSTSKDYVE